MWKWVVEPKGTAIVLPFRSCGGGDGVVDDQRFGVVDVVVYMEFCLAYG